ncbi:MAG: hypothetical protein NT007_18325 [Candidatus Kapabacteria bacterium]|nr:hypothetical protein [Candidatus Kapabacteria bacterium]
MLKLTVYLTLILITATTALARPQYSILQSYGIKCTGCHISINGGGARNAQGNISRNSISLIPADKIPVLGTVFDKISNNNSFFDDKIMWGMDVRYQSARWPAAADTVTLKRTARDQMIMQFTPYLIFTPVEWLQIDGLYNIASEIDARLMTGQQPWMAALTIKTTNWMDGWLPNFKAGKFQPGIGIRWDDHTVLNRYAYGVSKGKGTQGKNGEDYFSRTPLYPSDDYAEYGAELNFEKIDWLELAVGGFMADNLVTMSQITDRSGVKHNVVDSGSFSLTGKILVIPPVWHGIASFIGGTFLKNNDYLLSNAFLSFGIGDKFCAIAEFARSEKKDLRQTQAYLFEADYQIKDYLIPFVRLEHSVCREHSALNPIYATQYDFGMHLNLLPFIELIPEYRIFRYEHIPGYASQWTFQLHVFY